MGYSFMEIELRFCEFLLDQNGGRDPAVPAGSDKDFSMSAVCHTVNRNSVAAGKTLTNAGCSFHIIEQQDCFFLEIQ
jgi:hypothetical protein